MSIIHFLVPVQHTKTRYPSYPTTTIILILLYTAWCPYCEQVFWTGCTRLSSYGNKSTTMADIVIENIEQQALASFPHPPTFWKRYVNDTFVAILPSMMESFHKHLNSIEPSIQFTVETENDGQLAFLDINISRHSDGSLSTSVYRKKPTVINTYNSLHITLYLINSLLVSLCSPEPLHIHPHLYKHRRGISHLWSSKKEWISKKLHQEMSEQNNI